MNFVYIQNRSPHQILEEKTSKEVLIRQKPHVGHSRIFGCLIYIHVPKYKRKKLKPSGKKGIFYGYIESSKAYKIYILGKKPS